MSKYYPDVSHYDPVDNWGEVKEYCPFLISKATQGTDYIDPTLDRVVRECDRRRIPYWLYAYLNQGDERAQAEFLVRICREKTGRYFIGYVLDVEDGNAEAEVRRALDYLDTTGEKLMLYTMYAQYEKYEEVIRNRPERCAWWEARYGYNNGIYNADFPCHEGADLQQYTSNGTCPGITGQTDLNRITGQGKREQWFRSRREE